MWSVLRSGAAFVVVLAAGALLGSAIVQWRPASGGGDSVSVQPQIGPARGERIRVEVLNAGGRADMARRATDVLRSRGFDVVYFGNAERFGQDTSRVLDRVGRPEAARAVGRALGIARVRSEPERELYLDVTVRLGSDWEPEDARTETAPRDSAEWWDVPALIRDLRR